MKSKYTAEEKFQIVLESFSDNVTQAEIGQRHGMYPVQLSKRRGSSYRTEIYTGSEKELRFQR